jgi:phosphoribosylformylglycinamidine synthase
MSASDSDLKKLSAEAGIGLSVAELKKIRKYFKSKGRLPTDVELQSFGQAWSEHCCYKSSKVVLKKFLMPIKSNDVLAKGDAGVMKFNANYAYALRIESHNHPSAVEPYGGAATGIGGIVRDVLAMGAQPIALIDPLFFGTLTYPIEKLPAGIKHPKYLFSGVVAGIRDYGNRIGIPTVSGCVYFHDAYIGNCLVNVGCVGIVKRNKILKNAVSGAGDIFMLVGGRTGRDGIHGVTFASRVLTEASETEDRGAVQLGDPIMKEPVIHACLDANSQNLIEGLKDLGGGGLSCVIGEMALAGNCGAEIHLDKVPLKEEGLAPWEIWVSESQERMMLAVKPRKVSKVLKIFDLYDVPATPIGKAISEKVVRLFYNNYKVFEVDSDFLTKGPVYVRKRKLKKEKIYDRLPPEPDDYNTLLLSILSKENIASKDWVIRQYDHEVRANTIIKPLQGKVESQTHGDAVVFKPLEDSYKGLALAVGANPFITAIHPFKGGKWLADEACRNLAAAGAVPHSFTNCLNFGNPEKPERFAQFYDCVRGIGYVARYLGIPIPSGNVSFYNESDFSVVLPTATILAAGIVPDIRKCITSDLKSGGNLLYLIGKISDALGGSEYYRHLGVHSSKVPDVVVTDLKTNLSVLQKLIAKRIITSCHDISDGGLAVCIAEMCIGGTVGAEIDISKIRYRPDIKLFSESPSCWLVEVHANKISMLEKIAKDITVHKIGKVGGGSLKIYSADLIIDLSVNEIRHSWSNTLWRIMG